MFRVLWAINLSDSFAPYRDRVKRVKHSGKLHCLGDTAAATPTFSDHHSSRRKRPSNQQITTH